MRSLPQVLNDIWNTIKENEDNAQTVNKTLAVVADILKERQACYGDETNESDFISSIVTALETLNGFKGEEPFKGHEKLRFFITLLTMKLLRISRATDKSKLYDSALDLAGYSVLLLREISEEMNADQKEEETNAEETNADIADSKIRTNSPENK